MHNTYESHARVGSRCYLGRHVGGAQRVALPSSQSTLLAGPICAARVRVKRQPDISAIKCEGSDHARIDWPTLELP
eukprot:5310835-Prymnesium_polylepis.1